MPADGGFEPEAARAAKRPNPTLRPPAGAPTHARGRGIRARSGESRGATESHSLRLTLQPQPRSQPTQGDSSPKRREPRSDRIPLSPPNPRNPSHGRSPPEGIRARSGESRGATESHSLRHYEPRGRVVAERVGFEPTVGGSPLHTLSKRAPSTTRTSLRAAAPRPGAPDPSLPPASPAPAARAAVAFYGASSQRRQTRRRLRVRPQPHRPRNSRRGTPLRCVLRRKLLD